MAESSDTLKTILLVGAIGVGGYFIYKRFFKGEQRTLVAQPTTQQPIQVPQPTTPPPQAAPPTAYQPIQLPPPPPPAQLPSALSTLAEILKVAPPQPIQITAPTLEAGRAAAAEFAQYQTPWSTQLQRVAEFLQQYPTAEIKIVSPSFIESELPPPPPGEYFSYGILPETGKPVVYYAPQIPGIVVQSELPPPPPPG